MTGTEQMSTGHLVPPYFPKKSSKHNRNLADYMEDKRLKEIYDKERIICKLPFLSTYVFGQYHKQACDMHGYKND